MADRIAYLAVSIALIALVGAGCSTAPARFYTLDSTASPGVAPATRIAVVVGPVSVPDTVDRPEFVVQVASNQVDVEEFNRWAAPLADGIARAVAGDLSALLGTPDVAVGPLGNFAPVYRVTIDVQRFDSVQGQSATIDAMWTVHDIANGKTRSGRTVASEPVQGDGFQALAAAHSRVLAKISGDIAAAIRTESARKQQFR
ncbi:MAG TPA: PqiC family protein [Candidatus Binataceae bacterium]